MAPGQNIVMNAGQAWLSVKIAMAKEELCVTNVMVKPPWFALTAMGKGEGNLSLF